MKRLLDLTPTDLHRAPVWRYEGETDDIAVVHATARTELSASDEELFIARTQFALAGGAQHIGFCTPADGSRLDTLQPVIVTAHGPVYFWFDEPPTRDFLREQWRRLGADEASIFPVQFRCTVAVDGQLITGTIHSDDLTGAA
jgi:hypothetical protein